MPPEDVWTVIERWEAVSVRERDDLCASSPEARMRQLTVLTATAKEEADLRWCVMHHLNNPDKKTFRH